MPMSEGHPPGARVVVSPHWRAFYEAAHIPAAVRAGDTIRVAGHTGEGPDGLFDVHQEAQLRHTFGNLAQTLATAGVTWADVVQLTSYHVGLRAQAESLLAVAAEFLVDPYPAWTAVGVTELFEEGALVEISCVAVVPDS
jgi:enamine deaminase RidA (YjgF/YER057c/UK114 family)